MEEDTRKTDLHNKPGIMFTYPLQKEKLTFHFWIKILISAFLHTVTQHT